LQLHVHNNSAIVTVFRKPNPTRFSRTIGINDFYWGSEDFSYPMGHFPQTSNSQPEVLATAAPSTRLPGFGLALEYIARHGVDWWPTTAVSSYLRATPATSFPI
jgi:hypothetical protein